MSEKENTDNKRHFGPTSSYLVLGLFIVLTLISTYLIYSQIQYLFNLSLQQRALSLVTTSALQFNVDELELIEGPESADTTNYRNIVNKLQNIRLVNEDIKYVYIQKKTNDLHTLEFIADADAMDPNNPIDINENGVIDQDEELSGPGTLYDISEYPDFVEIAFTKPYVDGNPYVDEDSELSSDQWGILFSATAPIYNSNGLANYLIGIDIDVSKFMSLTNIAIVPFVLFVAFIILVLTLLTVFLVQVWGSRVNLLQEIDRQKDELLGIVSHQLATPVSSIKWYLEMMKDGDLGALNKEQIEHVSSMQEVSNNLTDLVSMILDVSRIQLGRVHVEKQDLDLGLFFKEIIGVIEPKALQKPVKLIKNMPEIFPAAKLDKRYTHMTIENLLSNAVKYTPENGTVEFSVTIKGNMMHCVVKDTGVGIPKADQEKIFGKMFRASNVRNSVDGNGFGLYVAKGAVEAQGGRIWFTSTEGKGTTFYVDLPLH